MRIEAGKRRVGIFGATDKGRLCHAGAHFNARARARVSRDGANAREISLGQRRGAFARARARMLNSRHSPQRSLVPHGRTIRAARVLGKHAAAIAARSHTRARARLVVAVVDFT